MIIFFVIILILVYTTPLIKDNDKSRVFNKNIDPKTEGKKGLFFRGEEEERMALLIQLQHYSIPTEPIMRRRRGKGGRGVQQK